MDERTALTFCVIGLTVVSAALVLIALYALRTSAGLAARMVRAATELSLRRTTYMMYRTTGAITAMPLKASDWVERPAAKTPMPEQAGDAEQSDPVDPVQSEFLSGEDTMPIGRRTG